MDNKKKQIQISNAKSKLDSYKETLISLQKTRESIKQNLINSNTDNSKLQELEEDHNNLESILKSLKIILTNNTNQITVLTQDLKNLTGNRNQSLMVEDIILRDELERIEIHKKEAQDLYDSDIIEAKLNKLKLIEDIDLITNSLQEQNIIITDLQIEAHSSRKNTLEQLHQKKVDKINMHKQLNNFKSQETFINNQIDTLKLSINNLNEFKHIIIDFEYASNQVSSDMEPSTRDPSSTPPIDINKMNTFYTEFNLDKSLSLNEKISNIEKQIKDYKARLDYTIKKLDKNKQSIDSRITTIVDNYNLTNRVKVIAYKDQFKIEKEKKTTLETILAELKYKYDTYETLAMGNIDSNLSKTLSDLSNDIVNAKNRLNITRQRIAEEFTSETKRLNDTILELNIKNIEYKASFDMRNSEFLKIKQMIQAEKQFSNELNKTDEKIKHYEDIIKQTADDIRHMTVLLT
uniref:Uncharacterized protein n=1 Tax=viral metagenome TaxID=1070528 RepID=A0A6C0EZ63_9ZZZZ